MARAPTDVGVAEARGARHPVRVGSPRPDPRRRCAGEQPQGRQHRDPEATSHGVHGCLGFGQELAGVRHDRRGVPAADQRDLQRLRAGLHADARPARGRRARGADDGDHRRPGGGWASDAALHRRDGHGRQRDAADPVQPARAHRTSAHRRRSRSTSPRSPGRVRSPLERGGRTTKERRSFSVLGGMCPQVRGPWLGQRHRSHPALRRHQVAQRGCAHDPGLQHGRLVRPDLLRLRLLRPGQAHQEVHQEASSTTSSTRQPTKIRVDGHQPDVRGTDPQDPEVDAVEGHRGDAAPHPGLRGARDHVHGVP